MIRPVVLAGFMMTAVVGLACPVAAAPRPAPGVQVADQDWKCTAGFAAQGFDGGNYLFTSGHCNHPEGAPWTYGGAPLGKITASEEAGDRRDAAIIRLDPGVSAVGDVGGRRVRDVLSVNQIEVGMPFCKLGAITGETCGVITSFDGELIVASVHAAPGDSGSAGYVHNPDGTVSAAGLLSGSYNSDENTSVYMLVDPLLGQWGLRILP